MNKFYKLSIFAAILAIAAVFAFSPSAVQADAHEFDLYVKHNINGRSLGLDKDLPVDIYINGPEDLVLESVTFKQSAMLELPEGEYTVKVYFAGTMNEVMSLGPVEIPAGVSVSIRATLGAGKAPTLRVGIK